MVPAVIRHSLTLQTFDNFLGACGVITFMALNSFRFTQPNLESWQLTINVYAGK